MKSTCQINPDILVRIEGDIAPYIVTLQDRGEIAVRRQHGSYADAVQDFLQTIAYELDFYC